jgi:hypothetical protein
LRPSSQLVPEDLLEEGKFTILINSFAPLEGCENLKDVEFLSEKSQSA